MKIAFTHNIQLSANEEEAEFNRPAAVQTIAESLGRLGHRVERVDISIPVSQLIARLIGSIMAPAVKRLKVTRKQQLILEKVV